MKRFYVMNQWIELEKVTSLIHSLLKISLYIKLNIENHFFQIITFHSELEAGGALNKKVVLSIHDMNISYRFGYSVGDVFRLLFFYGKKQRTLASYFGMLMYYTSSFKCIRNLDRGSKA